MELPNFADSEKSALVTFEYMQDSLHRLEKKVDKVVDTLNNFIRLDERQTTQSIKIAEMQAEVLVIQKDLILLEKKVDKWINMAVGSWAVISLLFLAYQIFFPKGLGIGG